MAGHLVNHFIAISIGALSASVLPQYWLPFATLALLSLAWASLRQMLAVSPSSIISVWAAGFAAGCWVQLHWDEALQQAVPDSQPPFIANVTGEVSNVRLVNTSNAFSYVSFDLKVKSVPAELDVIIQEGLSIQGRCYQCSLTMKSGQYWQLWMKLKPILSFQNPGGFNYRHWLLSQGYGIQGYVLLKDQYSHQLLKEAGKVKGRLSDHHDLIRSLIAQSKGSEFLFALLMGDKQALNAEQKRLLMYSGLGHLFVVSGLHVGLVALLFAFLLQPFFRPLVLLGVTNTRPISWIAGACFALIYAALSGFQIPAVRAVLMLGLGLIFFLSRYRQSPLLIVLLALLVVVAVQPLAFKSMGSWLSFTIVAALIWGFWERGHTPRFSFMKGLLRSQYYAFCAGALILVAFSVPVSLTGIGLNLIFIPLFSFFVLPLAMLGLVVALVTGDISLMQMAGTSMAWLFEQLQHMQPALKHSISLHFEAAFLGCIALVIMLLPFGNHVRALGILALLTAANMPSASLPKGMAKIQILDVGQGSSALVRTEHHTLLLDTGNAFNSGMTLVDFVVLPYLRRESIASLDRVLLSHDDADHAGGLNVLTKWGPEVESITTQSTCAERQWVWDDVQFEQMQASGFKEGNDGSCLLKITAGQQTVLFAGDIEAKAEKQLLTEYPELKVNVLVVPHHGSRTSSSVDWLASMAPQLGIISAGRFNRYGHPHRDITARYQAMDIALLGTYSHGAIEVVIGAGQDEIKVSTYAPSVVTFIKHL